MLYITKLQKMIFSSAHFQVTSHLTFFSSFQHKSWKWTHPLHPLPYPHTTHPIRFNLTPSENNILSQKAVSVLLCMYVHFRKYFTLLHCLLHVVVQVSWLIWIQIRFDFYAWWFRQQYINLVAFMDGKGWDDDDIGCWCGLEWI